MTEIPFFVSRAAFAMRVGQFAALLYDQMENCLESCEVRLPGYATSIVQVLFHGGAQSISDLARSLDLSHQLASQRVTRLVGDGLAMVVPGSADRRFRIVRLTNQGRAQAEKLQDFLPLLQDAYSDLFDEIGQDVHRAVLDAAAALARRPLSVRFATSQNPDGASPSAAGLPDERNHS